eukprot:11158458-Lingulodinium_polyedra.AAC.1
MAPGLVSRGGARPCRRPCDPPERRPSVLPLRSLSVSPERYAFSSRCHSRLFVVNRCKTTFRYFTAARSSVSK